MHVLNNFSTLALLAAAEVSQRGVTGSWEGNREARHPRDQEPPGDIPPPRFPGRADQPSIWQPAGGVLPPWLPSLSKGVGAVGLKTVLQQEFLALEEAHCETLCQHFQVWALAFLGDK